MDPSEASDFNARRRDEHKRRRVETAVERLIRHRGLALDRMQELSEGIYRLYGDLVAQKTFDDQDRHYRKWIHRAERTRALRTADGSVTEVSAHVAYAREFAARMIRLEIFERRNLGRGTAIAQASKATWDDLSPQEKRKARLYLARDVNPGDNTRQPAREAEFLRSIAGLIEQATGRRISFSSGALGSSPRSSGRHHGVEFDVMMAAAEMADYELSNEAMARRIQRIRCQLPARFSVKHS
jgi:hypothetical protein